MHHDVIQEKEVLPFEPILRAEVVCKDRISVCMVLYAPFLFILMQHDYFQNKNVETSYLSDHFQKMIERYKTLDTT